MGDKCKIMRPKTPRVKDKCGRQVETSVNSCAPRHPEWEIRVGDKWEFTLVFHLSPTLVFHSGCLGPHDFTLVSHTCLPHLSPTLGALGRMSLHLSSTCLPHVSPTLDVWVRMSLHLSPTLVSHTCVPLLFPTLVSHSGFFGLRLHLSPTCLPHLSPTLGSLVRMYNIIENFYICLGSTLV